MISSILRKLALLQTVIDDTSPSTALLLLAHVDFDEVIRKTRKALACFLKVESELCPTQLEVKTYSLLFTLFGAMEA
jgi:hypothetical protein